jgi:hypothetical protein
MIFYDVQLIHPETKEIYFQKISEKPELPQKEVIDKYRGAMIIIKTTTSLCTDQFAQPK